MSRGGTLRDLLVMAAACLLVVVFLAPRGPAGPGARGASPGVSDDVLREMEREVVQLYETDEYVAAHREEIFTRMERLLARPDASGFPRRTDRIADWIQRARPLLSRSPRPGSTRLHRLEYAGAGAKKRVVRTHFAVRVGSRNAEPQPLLVCVLEPGRDDIAFVEDLARRHRTIAEDWTVVAIVADPARFPVFERPRDLIKLLVWTREVARVDPDRWFLMGEGTTCAPVQRLATESIPDRIAGLVLRNPTLPPGSPNAAMLSAFVACSGDRGASAVASAWQRLDPDRNEVVAAAPDDLSAAVHWLSRHSGRPIPRHTTFATRITDGPDSGSDWSGTLRIVQPVDRSRPVLVHTTYDRTRNRIDVRSDNLRAFWVVMNDDLVDLDRSVEVCLNGEVVAERVFVRDLRTMFETADTVGEFGRLFTACYEYRPE